jgi:hypothetical protein
MQASARAAGTLPQPHAQIVHKPTRTMMTLIHPIAAIGYSIIYLLLGGGLGGALIIFLIAKMFRK